MLGRNRIAIAVAIAVAVAVIAGAAITLWVWRGRSEVEQGFLVEIQATDGGAVLLWQTNYPDRKARGWVSRVDASGDTLWWHELPDTASSGGALLVGEGVVTVRYSHHTRARPFGKDHALIAFALADGSLLWDRTLAAFQPVKLESGDETEPSLDLYKRSGVVDGRLVQWVDQGEPGKVLLVLDPLTGGELTRSKLGGALLSGVLATGARVLVHGVSTARSFDVRTGATASSSTRGRGCVVDDDYVAIVGEPGEAALVAFHDGDLSSRRVVEAPFDPVSDPGVSFLVRSCGRYRDRLVFLLRAGEPATAATQVVITTRSGQILHTIRLPHDQEYDGLSIGRRYLDRASLSGELTRFVPYLSISSTGEDRLYMLDLEAGRTAWKSRDLAELPTSHLFRATDHWYWVAGMSSPTVTVFDGKTGAVAGAVQVYDHGGVARILPSSVRDGRLWIASGDWRPIDRAPVAILDAHRLTRLGGDDTIELRDVTEAQRVTVQGGRC